MWYIVPLYLQYMLSQNGNMGSNQPTEQTGNSGAGTHALASMVSARKVYVRFRTYQSTLYPKYLAQQVCEIFQAPGMFNSEVEVGRRVR